MLVRLVRLHTEMGFLCVIEHLMVVMVGGDLQEGFQCEKLCHSYSVW